MKRRYMRHADGSQSALSWHRAIYMGSAGRREIMQRKGYVLAALVLCQECSACLSLDKHVQVNDGIQLIEVKS